MPKKKTTKPHIYGDLDGPCPECNGEGFYNCGACDLSHKCGHCEGSGFMTKYRLFELEHGQSLDPGKSKQYTPYEN